MNMSQLENYTTRIEGNNFYVQVGNTETGDAYKKSASITDRITSDISDYSASINNVDFRRGENGEGKILISLTDPNVSINVEDQSGTITLNFQDTQLPVNLRRKLDVTDLQRRWCQFHRTTMVPIV